SYFEYEYFQPSFEEFEKHTSLGTAEDKRFFGTGIHLNLAFPRVGRWSPPRMEKTWDYGGCFRFGEFRWAETMDEIVNLRKDLQPDIYRKMASDWETSLMDDLTDEGEVCTCKEKGAVIEDLKATLAFLQTKPALSVHVPRVQAKIQSIETKKTTVASEAEKHCSGGRPYPEFEIECPRNRHYDAGLGPLQRQRRPATLRLTSIP